MGLFGLRVKSINTVLTAGIRFFSAWPEGSAGYSHTGSKPGTLLKDKIPVRTFADWNDVHPGFLEMDLVAHCGESVAGEYLHTLNAVDRLEACPYWWPQAGASLKYSPTAANRA
jgi:hypothetical protein